MKCVLPGSLVSAFFIVALPTPGAQADDARRIEVMLWFDEGGATGGVGTTLPAMDGFEQGGDGGRIGDSPHELCRVQAHYRVIEITPAHFNVRVHYQIYLDALKKTVVYDHTLRVLPPSHPGNARGAIAVDRGIMANAHFIDPSDTVRD
jgi:hypothetical protein